MIDNGYIFDESTITGEELRARLRALGQPYTEAAKRLGLTNTGLQKQMRGERRVSRQTELLLEYLEALHSGRLRYHRPYPHRATEQGELPLDGQVMRRRREGDLAQHLYPTSRRTRS